MNRRLIALFVVGALLVSSTTACCFGELTKAGKKTFTKRTVTANPLHFISGGGKGVSGGYGVVKVTVEPNPKKQLRVGFFENEVSGTGPQWKAAGWMAAIMGASLLGRDVSDFKFTFDLNGPVDGPSAGGLMTASVVACILGADIKKDVTMTGTINPDGTIGPVGGIPQKLDGAKKGKKKKVLIPIGQRYDYDANEDRWVDVVKLGREKGLEVKEVGTIYEAYKELTGKDLPKFQGATTAKPDLPSDVYEKVKSKSKKLYSDYQELRAMYDQVSLPAEMDTSSMDSMVLEADDFANEGDGYLAQGMVASSYDSFSNAVLYTSMAYHIKKSVEAYFNTGGVGGAIDYLDTVSPAGLKIDALMDDLKARKPKTLADTIILADAYANLSVALGLVDVADSYLQSDTASEEEAFENAMLATVFYAAASHMVEAAEDSVDIGMGIGTAKPVDKSKIRSMSQALRKAADANIEYFDSIIINELAESEGMSRSAARASFMSNDLDYAFAVSSANNARYFEEKLGKTEAGAISVLGNALASYAISSGLIAKYYSLGAKLDDDGNIVSVAYEKALINMLDMAEESTLENMNAANKIGAKPVLTMLYYEGAKTLREGNLDNKLEAMTDYWLGATEARTLVILAGLEKGISVSEGEGGKDYIKVGQ